MNAPINSEKEFVELKPIIRQKDSIEKVESFIQHIRNLDYIVDTSIREVVFKGEYLFDILAVSISNYERFKDDPTTKWKYSEICLKWINTAYTYGVIREGQGLASRFKECSEENAKLNEKIEILSDALMKAKERIEELEQMMPSAGCENA